MKIATWNVNSVKARADRLLRFLDRERPDVLCLQEIKVVEDQFPFIEIEAAGYHAVVNGQKTYNGVAILSLQEPTAVSRGLRDVTDDPEARLIEAVVESVRVISAYVPNGKTVGSEKYEYKLEWLRRLAHFLDATASRDDDLMVCGDLNIAPDDSDVAFPEQWADSVLCHSAVREAFETLTRWGLHDVVRTHHPDGGPYSWWDYRMLGFPKGNGLRIDHILATSSLANRCVSARVDRDERKGKLPSDHAPVIAEFD